MRKVGAKEMMVFLSLLALILVLGVTSGVRLMEGAAAPGSRAQCAANLNILFYLMLFNSLIRTQFLPLPLLRLVYLALGARPGCNTYSAGTLLDPPLTTIGSNSIVGHDAVVFSHVIEGERGIEACGDRQRRHHCCGGRTEQEQCGGGRRNMGRYSCAAAEQASRRKRGCRFLTVISASFSFSGSSGINPSVPDPARPG